MYIYRPASSAPYRYVSYIHCYSLTYVLLRFRTCKSSPHHLSVAIISSMSLLLPCTYRRSPDFVIARRGISDLSNRMNTICCGEVLPVSTSELPIVSLGPSRPNSSSPLFPLCRYVYALLNLGSPQVPKMSRLPDIDIQV